jgi:uncharacterized protein YecE (DUF72 family)
MITVGCAGFPVPATRYFKEFLFVEVQDTHVAPPGPGTVRRWRREAPEGFNFAMVGPREIGQEGFRDGMVVETALKTLESVGKELSADTVVLVAPNDFTATRPNKAAVKDLLAIVRQKFARVVFDPGPNWDADETEALANEAKAIAARDPLTAGISKGKVAYYRLPGPAGHKSRYEDPAIDRLGDLARSVADQEATYVFTNVDMFADAKRLKKVLKLLAPIASGRAMPARSRPSLLAAPAPCSRWLIHSGGRRDGQSKPHCRTCRQRGAGERGAFSAGDNIPQPMASGWKPGFTMHSVPHFCDMQVMKSRLLLPGSSVKSTRQPSALQASESAGLSMCWPERHERALSQAVPSQPATAPSQSPMPSVVLPVIFVLSRMQA